MVLMVGPRPSRAYSQFTHQELIDLVWTDSIRPLLLQRYPGLTEAQLQRAHAFAYGGSLIQDIGYYPFGRELFSDLTHYARSGDFVWSLLHGARNAEEFAFAIGALSHYVGDSIGHSQAVNRSVPLLFPKLGARYGPIVIAEQSRTAHARTEFGFDVAQATRQRFASPAYRKHIGFLVARPLLYRAFRETYGIPTRGILGPARAAASSYKWSVRKLLPLFLRAEVVILRDDLPVEDDTTSRSEFLAELTRTEHDLNWSGTYKPLGFGPHAAALLIRIIPKIGALKALAVKPPTSTTEQFYFGSAVEASSRLRQLLGQMASEPDLEFRIEDLNLDTGHRTAPGESKNADQTYARLLSLLVGQKTAVPAEVRDHIFTFFAKQNGPSRLSRKEWTKVLADMDALRERYADH